MSDPTTPASSGSSELDVRDVPKPQRHSLIFERFASLPPLASFVLVNGHDPKHLRQEFDRDHPGAFEWSYLERGPVWRIQIGRLSSTDLPRVVDNTTAYASADATNAENAGAVWQLEMSQRQLDADVVRLQPHGQIDSHTGPDLDALMHILSGSGQLVQELESIDLDPGSLVWLPRRSRRSIAAGADGMTYLTVRPRRPGLSIDAVPSSMRQTH